MIKLIEVAGFKASISGLRNPTKSKGDSVFENGMFGIGQKDYKLAMSLIKKGDDHGKFSRGIIAWFDITAPRYIWTELDTYVVGMSPVSSESTIYTLLKECKKAGSLADMFEKGTSGEVISHFEDFATYVVANLDEGNIDANTARLMLKQALPESFLQKRTRAFSYQTLRRIYNQRKGHPMPFWETFRKEIEKLPMSFLIVS